MKNNYNFGVVKLHLKFNQRTNSTPHKFQTCFPIQNLILFQLDLCLWEGMRLKMEKLNRIISKIARYWIIILFTVVVITMLIFNADYDVFTDTPSFQFSNIYNYISIFINIALLVIVCKIIKRFNIDFKYIIGTYILLGVIYIILIPFEPFSDMKMVYEIAVSGFKLHQDYISFYTNNIPTVILMMLFTFLYKSIIIVKIINIICNIIIAYLTYKIAENLGKKNKLYFILCLLNIPVFLYINIIYNDIAFTLLTTLLIYLTTKNNKGKWNLPLRIILSVIEFMIRPVGIIHIIAITMYEVLSGKNYKLVAIFVTATTVGIVICNLLIGLFFNKSEESCTIWSFIRMGFNEEKFGFQDGTASSKWQPKDVIERWKELGVGKIIEIIAKKEIWMFSEGTYMAERYAFGGGGSEFTTENALTKDIQKNQESVLRKGAEYIMKGQYFIIIVCALFGVINKKKSSKYVLLNYIVVGLFCFYCFWEIKSRYIYSLYPIFTIYAVDGIEILGKKIKRKDV